MAETRLEKYRRLVAEVKALEPKPATPIEGLEIDPGEEGGVKITTNGEGQEIQWRELKLEAAKGLVYPSIVVTDEQMNALCLFWAKAREEARV